jgi:hypothetical protein
MQADTQEVRTTRTPVQKRSPLYLLTGLILGLILGLVYAWVINPVVYEDSAPASLADVHKDSYRSTIAQVYAFTGDMQRAALRLALLQDPDPVNTLNLQAQRSLARGRATEASALALLASALQGLPQYQEIPADTVTPQPATTDPLPAVPTFTLPIPTATP